MQVVVVRQRCQEEQELLGEVQRNRGVAELKKVLAEAEKIGLSELFKIADVIWA